MPNPWPPASTGAETVVTIRRVDESRPSQGVRRALGELSSRTGCRRDPEREPELTL